MSERFSDELTAEQKSLMGRLMLFCLTNKLVVALVVLFAIGWGIIVAPFGPCRWMPSRTLARINR
jgi:hypothetical protein